MMDVDKIRKDFPILSREVNGKPFGKSQGRPLVYLDNAATSQKPNQVIKALTNYYQKHNANIHRGIHTLGDEATQQYAKARETVADFVGSKTNEIVFVRNATEGINLVAYGWGEENISDGDVILTTEMEHHSNIVPWQELARRKKAKVEYVVVDEKGMLDVDNFEEKLKLKPKLVALTHVSNFLGTINDVERLTQMSKSIGATVLIDGAQAVPHMKVELGKLGADFYVFSGHKMLAPMGIGVLWGRKELLEKMHPFLFGGGMIDEVSVEKSKYTVIPDRFDAGTPNVAGAVALAAAVNYLRDVGMDKVREHEQELTTYALDKLNQKNWIKVFGPKNSQDRGGVVAFVMEGVHAHDVAQILDRHYGVAVRSGHHCTMPMHTKIGIPASTRASFYVYNTTSEIDTLIEGLNYVRKVLA